MKPTAWLNNTRSLDWILDSASVVKWAQFFTRVPIAHTMKSAFVEIACLRVRRLPRSVFWLAVGVFVLQRCANFVNRRRAILQEKNTKTRISNNCTDLTLNEGQTVSHPLMLEQSTCC